MVDSDDIRRQNMQTYNRLADFYDAHVTDAETSPLHQLYEKPAMRAALGNLANQTLLEIGAGTTGDLPWKVAQNPEQIYAFDIAERQIAHLQTKKQAAHLLVADVALLPFRDAQFDVASASLVMHYVADWRQPLVEVSRVLKPGGRFVFSCLHPIESALTQEIQVDTRSALLGRVISNESGKRSNRGNYLAPKEKGIYARSGTIGDTFEVVQYHRTFSNMLSAILASGFTIESFIEPEPNPAMQETHPDYFIQLSNIPKFCIWALKKEVT